MGRQREFSLGPLMDTRGYPIKSEKPELPIGASGYVDCCGHMLLSEGGLHYPTAAPASGLALFAFMEGVLF